MVHASGFLFGRHRKNFVPCRNRPPLNWSYLNSTTSVGSSASHSPDRSLLHRRGPPAATPPNPASAPPHRSLPPRCCPPGPGPLAPPPALAGSPRSSISGFTSPRPLADLAQQNPAWCSSQASSYRPRTDHPTDLVSFEP